MRNMPSRWKASWREGEPALRPTGAKGLTLIEVLLALALLGLAATALFSFYYSVVRSWRRSVDRIDWQQNARAAMELIDRELRFADWLALAHESEIRYKLSADFKHDDPRYYRRIRLVEEQLVIEEIRGGSIYSYNVAALGMKTLHFELDALNNVRVKFTVGDNGNGVTLQSCVRPRKLPLAGGAFADWGESE